MKKDAKIFLFDEATSSLDGPTEKAIMQELNSLLDGKTSIFCAHRLSSIVNVDKIHVLKDGKVHEVGSHEELIAKNGYYKELWDSFQKEN